MSSPGTTNVPSITGFPVIDTLLKWAIGIAATALAAWTASWMQQHGWQSKYFTTETLFTLFVPAIVALATAAWAAISKYRTIVAFVEQVLEAARNGQVSSEVKSLATAPQAARIEAVNRANK